jgi:hypothetical protein
MPNRDLTGMQVGDLTVVKHWFGETWACLCSCGREALVHRDDLINSLMRSCGCKPGTRRSQLRPGFWAPRKQKWVAR